METKYEEVALKDVLDKELVVHDFTQIDICYDDLDVGVFTQYKVKQSIIEMLYDANIHTIKDLKRVNALPLGKPLTRMQEVNISSVIELFSLNPMQFLFTIIKRVDFRTKNILKLRAKGVTLQEIADEMWMTRERIRQIVKKELDKVKPICNVLFKENEYITGVIEIESLSLYVQDDYIMDLIFLSLNMYDDFKFITSLNKIVETSIYPNIEETLLQISKTLIRHGENINEIENDLISALISANLDFVTLDNYKAFLLENKYYILDSYIFTRPPKISEICNLVIVDTFKDGIKLHYGEDLQHLRSIVYERYGIVLPKSDRALSARLEDDLVLCDRGKVISTKHVHIKQSTFRKIIEYIYQTKLKYLSYNEIFTKFESLLQSTSNINNASFLHGILKYYYPEEFIYNKRDVLEVKGNQLKDASLQERVESFVEQKGIALRKEILKEHLGMSDAVLNNIVNESTKILFWGETTYIYVRLLDSTKQELDALKQAIEHIQQNMKGYCHQSMIYEYYVTYNPIFLETKRIEKPTNFFHYIEYFLADDFDIKNGHICRKNEFKKLNAKDIYLQYLDYPKCINYHKYHEIVSGFGWATITANLTFRELNLDFFRINENEYLQISEVEAIIGLHYDEIDEILASKMEEGRLSLLTFNAFDDLPKLSIPWNIYLLNEIVGKCSKRLKKIEPIAKDRRYIRSILIENTSSISSYDELILDLLKRLNQAVISKLGLLHLLKEYGLTSVSIPNDLYISKYFEFKDEMFYIQT